MTSNRLLFIMQCVHIANQPMHYYFQFSIEISSKILLRIEILTEILREHIPLTLTNRIPSNIKDSQVEEIFKKKTCYTVIGGRRIPCHLKFILYLRSLYISSSCLFLIEEIQGVIS